MSWVTYGHLFYTKLLANWGLFGCIVPAMCNRKLCSQVHELPQSSCGNGREGKLFLWLDICYARLAFVRSEHSRCQKLHMTIYITLLALLVEHSLAHWYQQLVNVHHLQKCMSCHKAIVLITRRKPCFHDYIYTIPISVLQDLITPVVVDHLWPLTWCSWLGLLGTLCFIGTSYL